MDRSLLFVFSLALLPSVLGTFSVSKQYERRHKEVGPVAIDLTDSHALDAPEDIFQEAKDRRRRQTQDQTLPYTTSAFLSVPSETYAIVHWDGLPKTTVFILTVAHERGQVRRNGGVRWCTLWRSTDYGVTFTNETGKWNVEDAKANWYYISQDDDRYIVFTDLMNKRLYITEDEGVTYRKKELDITPYIIKFIPSSAPWLKDGDYAKLAFVHDYDTKKVSVTDDLFKTYYDFPDNITAAFWGYTKTDEPGVIYFDSEVTNGRKILKQSTYPHSGESAVNTHTRYFDKFWLSHDYVFVADYSSSARTELWVSHMRKDFMQAEFPLRLPGKHYSLVDASEGQVFMAVYHDVNNTALYISQETGHRYSLSLSHLISSEGDEWESGNPIYDLHLVEGLNGVILANIQNPNSRYGASVISYDKGGEWSAITPPSVGADGSQLLCNPPSCSLHFHMDVSVFRGFSGILSRESAVGMVMAQGNIGTTLSPYASQMRLFMSTNGGYSWSEVVYSRSIQVYQFLDFGSITIFTKRWWRTHTFNFSCDEGLTWTEVDYPTSSNLNVAGMLTELGEKALHATIFGYTSPFNGWYIIGVNFTSVMTRQCQPSDYTRWSPTDEHLSRECLLGLHEEFERRNSTTCCYNGIDYERPQNVHSCSCAIEDYECDYGFQRDDSDVVNSPCLPIPGMNVNAPPSNCPEGEYYAISSGYRKVAGDKCVRNGSNFLQPIRIPCPIDPPGSLQLNFKGSFNIEFNLAQDGGGKLKTVYTWDFGDSTSISITGYENAKHMFHNYTMPGDYQVVVTAANAEGRATITATVNIPDRITRVSVVGPTQGLVGVPIVFKVSVTTENGMDYQPAVYSWSVDDDTTVSASGEQSFSHAFTNGTHEVACIVSNPIGGIRGSITVRIHTGSVGVDLVASLKKLIATNEVLVISVQITNVTTGDGSDLRLHFSFGDNEGTDIHTKGKKQLTEQHAYTHPGTYDIHITVYSSANSLAASYSASVTVLSPLGKVNIIKPSPDGPIVGFKGTTIVFELRSYDKNERPVEGTTFGSVFYSVNFGDNTMKNESSSVFEHTYEEIDDYTFSVTANNGVSQVSVDRPIKIVQEPGNNDVKIQVNNDKDVAAVGEELQFSISVNIKGLDDEQKSSLLNLWTAQWWVTSHLTSTSTHNITNVKGGHPVAFTFNNPDSYEIHVEISRQGVFNEKNHLFSTQKTVEIRARLDHLDLQLDKQVALVNEDVHATISLFSTRSIPYDHFVKVKQIVTPTITGYPSDHTYPALTGGVITWSLKIEKKDNFKLQVQADNDVSSVSETSSIEVVDPFGTVNLLFTLPDNHPSDDFWINQFEQSMINDLATFTGEKKWRFRVKVSELGENGQGHDFLVAVSVLPADNSEDAKQEAAKLTEMVTSFPSSGVGFKIPDVSGTRTASLYDNQKVPSSSSGISSSVIAGIIVAAVFIIVIIVVVMSLLIALLYKKYRRLETRYSRLSQTATVTFATNEDDDDDDPPVEMGGPQSVPVLDVVNNS